MSARGDLIIQSRCTEECDLYGHSDTCWMPESLQRPPSRMTSFKAAEGEWDVPLEFKNCCAQMQWRCETLNLQNFEEKHAQIDRD